MELYTPANVKINKSVYFDADPYLLAVNKPSGLPTLPGGGFMENTLLRLAQVRHGTVDSRVFEASDGSK